MAEESTPRIADRAERNAASSFRDNAAGAAVDQPAVTGRPTDIAPGSKVTNTTFAERAKARSKDSKAVESADTEDKSVGRSERKSTKGRR